MFFLSKFRSAKFWSLTSFFLKAKDKLHNDIISKLAFEFPESYSQISAEVDVVVSVLWYLDGTVQKIVNRSENNSSVKPIPKR